MTVHIYQPRGGKSGIGKVERERWCGSHDLFRSQHVWQGLVTMDTQKNGLEPISFSCFHPFRSRRIPQLPRKNPCSRRTNGSSFFPEPQKNPLDKPEG